MGTVRRIAPAAGDITLGGAAAAYLATLGGAEQESTRRTYGRILRRMTAEFGSGTTPGEITAEMLVVWHIGTARVRPGLVTGGTSGPVFGTHRRARVQLPAADLDPSGRARLGDQEAEALCSAASGGATLHQLRHSALTHDAEDGTGT